MVRGKTKAYKEQSFDNLRGLDGISEDQIAEHLKLYAGYVKQVNSLNQELAELLSKGRASGKDPAFAELTRRLGFEYNGMILHEYYFSNLRPAAEPAPASGSALGHALGEAFGSLDAWRTELLKKWSIKTTRESTVGIEAATGFARQRCALAKRASS